MEKMKWLVLNSNVIGNSQLNKTVQFQCCITVISLSEPARIEYGNSPAQLYL